MQETLRVLRGHAELTGELLEGSRVGHDGYGIVPSQALCFLWRISEDAAKAQSIIEVTLLLF